MKTREYTNKIIEMVDEGVVDRDILIRDLLNWMFESDVVEFFVFTWGIEEPDDEDDGQPSEMDEWHDYDPGC